MKTCIVNIKAYISGHHLVCYDMFNMGTGYFCTSDTFARRVTLARGDTFARQLFYTEDHFCTRRHLCMASLLHNKNFSRQQFRTTIPLHDVTFLQWHFCNAKFWHDDLFARNIYLQIFFSQYRICNIKKKLKTKTL